MIVAAYPEDLSEGTLDGIGLAGASIVSLGELDPPDLVADADVLLVELGDQPMRRLREISRIVEDVGLPVMLVVETGQLPLMESADFVADFVISPVNPIEMRLRLGRLTPGVVTGDLLTFKDLELNLLTYQATVAASPLDLTFMEWELLRFLVENPSRVWSREQLLSKVWGYDYYGGARTVDVHVRRLRAKLGEERSSWISTVRSVGYRFG